VEAAFFDLDKTVISKASMMAFGRAFHREGLLNRRALAQGLWTQVLYARFGAGPDRLARIRRSALAITKGWDQAQVRRIVDETLGTVMAPITYGEAIELIARHREAGRRVYLVSAAPAEIVGPLADHLGVHEAIASRPLVDSRGRYTGELERYCYGPVKATLIEEAARRDGVDLDASWAYSDSATDLPMLEAVGHPVAVNPDRVLRRIAHLRGWEVRHFERAGVPSPAFPPETVLTSNAAAPPPTRPETDRLVVASLALAALSSGGAAWLALRRLPRPAVSP
jgi:HAD superfamily hydrolase (TIGR01490 family)